MKGCCSGANDKNALQSNESLPKRLLINPFSGTSNLILSMFGGDNINFNIDINFYTAPGQVMKSNFNGNHLIYSLNSLENSETRG